MAAKHLRAVAPGEAPSEPKRPIESVEDAVLYGTSVDVLEQSLLVAARALDDAKTPAVAKAALLNRVSALKAEMEAMKKATEEEAREQSEASDEEWDEDAI